MSEDKIDVGLYIEALDRLHNCREIVDNMLKGSPVITANEEYVKTVDDVVDALGKLYHKIGIEGDEELSKKLTK